MRSARNALVLVESVDPLMEISNVSARMDLILLHAKVYMLASFLVSQTLVSLFQF